MAEIDAEGTTPGEPGPDLRTGRVSRSIPLVSMGARTGFARAGVALTPGSREARERRTRRYHEKTAERYAALLGDMKGALMKAGQILSFVHVASLVPDEYQDVYGAALEALQADAPPMPYAAVADIIEAELGAPPEKVFDRFSPFPIAAASIGQVHAARLGDRELAVKVQYPGVAEAIRADLDNTELLASLMRTGARMLPGFSTKVDFRVVAEEVRERIGEELDYENEAAYQQEFAAIYDGHPFIRIPAVSPDLSTSRVLTMEMVDGRRFKAACESPQELRDQWGEAILRFVYGSIHRHRLFNADPHPGNYLFHEDGTVTFLDFGCVKRYTEEQERLFRLGSTAILHGDAAALHAHLVELGSLPDPNAVTPERLWEWYQGAAEPLLGEQPYQYTREWASAEVQRQFDPFNEWKDVSRNFAIPKDVLFLSRIFVGLNSVLGILEATCPSRGIAREIYDGAPPCSEMGRAEAEWRASTAAV
ncbi:MAG TPA: AarF/ABC1/UbiB kinase family protein [Acidimicrobiia bacterium]|nr:AarF/ABC1/UbiB kinase family protein [Acidimicrobiia bacterium]